MQRYRIVRSGSTILRDVHDGMTLIAIYSIPHRRPQWRYGSRTIDPKELPVNHTVHCYAGCMTVARPAMHASRRQACQCVTRPGCQKRLIWRKSWHGDNISRDQRQLLQQPRIVRHGRNRSVGQTRVAQIITTATIRRDSRDLDHYLTGERRRSRLIQRRIYGEYRECHSPLKCHPRRRGHPRSRS